LRGHLAESDTRAQCLPQTCQKAETHAIVRKNANANADCFSTLHTNTDTQTREQLLVRGA
jgi:hypothetical protein